MKKINKIILMLGVIFAFGQMSYASQIKYPSSSVLIPKFKSEFDFNYFKKMSQLSDNVKLSDCKLAIKKYDGRTWFESRSVDLIYKSWPNDVLKGYVEISAPKNKYGEKITSIYTVIYRRSVNAYGTLKMLDKWVYNSIELKNTKIVPFPLDIEKTNSTLTSYVLNEVEFDKKMKDKMIRINKIYWDRNKKDYIERLVYSNKFPMGIKISTWTIPIIIESIFQYKEYDKLITKKVNIHTKVGLKRDENGNWFVDFFNKSLQLKKENYNIPDNKRYGALAFYSTKDIYQKYMPYKIKPNSEEGKMEFAKMIVIKLKALTYEIENKSAETTEIEKYVSKNDLKTATNIWEKFYNLKGLQLNLSEEKYCSNASSKVKSHEEDDKRIYSKYSVEYKANRNLSKKEIKQLKKIYDMSVYYKYWRTPLVNKSYRITYHFIYENNKWSITSVDVPFR
jgi:hypothetical protein